MIDPVSRFEYPDTWVSRCLDQTSLSLVGSGLAVLTSDGRVLRRGFTTGTTAAAACKAAIESLGISELGTVKVRTASGLVFPVPVVASEGIASCRKYPGDYPEDATAGIELKARFIRFQDEVCLDIGPGIGRWDHDTPRYSKGGPAISHTAMDCIVSAISWACLARGERGALVRLEAIGGEHIARQTLNGRIGVQGGISVLGSTGLVEPWDDHLGQDAIDRAKRAERAVITTGRIGLRHARLQYPDREVILVGANMKAVLDSRSNGLVLFGLPALIIKFIDPSVLGGRGFRTVEELVLSVEGPPVVHSSIKRFKSMYPGHGIAIIDRDGHTMEAAP